MRYLLDNNMVSALVRDPEGPVTERVRIVREANVCTSIVVAAELRYGATKKGAPRLSAQVKSVLSALEMVPLEAPADSIYGELRAGLERAGLSIHGNDLLIAAHALALGYAVVTDNQREFERVKDLRVENWSRT